MSYGFIELVILEFNIYSNQYGVTLMPVWEVYLVGTGPSESRRPQRCGHKLGSGG